MWLIVTLLLSVAESSQLIVPSGDSVFRGCGNDPCPPWQINFTGTCVCPIKTFDDVIQCRDDPYELRLHKCYCITCSQSRFLFGPCQFTCTRKYNGVTFVVEPNNTNEVMCGSHNRQGQMCGQCKPGYAPPVYSYSLSCVNCTTSNWGKYTAVSLLPLTAFFVFVVAFRISATSPRLHGLVLCIQIIMCPLNARLLQDMYHCVWDEDANHIQSHIVSIKVTTSFIGIWNLDFFRFVYPPFCLHPHTNTLQVLALDYLVAVYPLLLIGLSYLGVLLYDHNVHHCVWLCKPFVSLFIKFRRQWNIRSSLVDAFATFLLLSYVKILSVSVDLLLPVTLYDQNGQQLPQLYLFNQGDVAYFSSHHLPYACLALFFLLTFTLLPMALLFLYPCSCFQVCLNRTGLSCQSLHIFMDSFQGHYKNGTNGTRDFRSLSALCLLLRLLVYCSLVFTYETKSYGYPTAIILIFTVVTAIVKPFKGSVNNITTTLFLLFLSLTFIFVLPVLIDGLSIKTHSYAPASIALLVGWCSYITVYFLYWVTPSKVWQTPVLKNAVLQCWKYRFFHRDGYESLKPF